MKEFLYFLNLRKNSFMNLNRINKKANKKTIKNINKAEKKNKLFSLSKRL